jgi:hypothetical protein
MQEPSKHFFIHLLSLTILVLVFPLLLRGFYKPPTTEQAQGYSLSPTPTPFKPFPYKVPEIPVMRAYRIMLVGDSMVEALGPNAQLLRQHLIELYPENEFVDYNYGFGATSIETLPERLSKETEYNGNKYQSVLSQGFDLIIIGSFAYNPLSQEELDVGIEKHIKVLDNSIREIIKQKPESVVALLLPIAPSKTHFAEGVYNLSPEERKSWAEQRIAYIKAVKNYAEENNIPLINVYERSLNQQGEGNLIYINPDDFIHPSAEGVDLMSRTIAGFIYDNSIFPR